MTQTFLPIDPAVPGGDTGASLAAKLNDWRTTINSLHSGGSRPSYASAGLLWRDTTTSPWVLRMYDGSDDIPIATIDPATHAVERVYATPATVGQIVAGTASEHAGKWIDPPGLQGAFATASQVRARTARRILTALGVAEALAEVTISAASSTIALNMDTFVCGAVTLTANRTLAVPTNGVFGLSGQLRIIQGTGGNRLLSYAAGWHFPGRVAPVLSTAVGAVDILSFSMLGTSSVWGVLSNDVGAP